MLYNITRAPHDPTKKYFFFDITVSVFATKKECIFRIQINLMQGEPKSVNMIEVTPKMRQIGK